MWGGVGVSVTFILHCPSGISHVHFILPSTREMNSQYFSNSQYFQRKRVWTLKILKINDTCVGLGSFSVAVQHHCLFEQYFTVYIQQND